MYVFLQEDCSIEERHCNQSFRQSVLGFRSINFFLGVAKIHVIRCSNYLVDHSYRSRKEEDRLLTPLVGTPLFRGIALDR